MLRVTSPEHQQAAALLCRYVAKYRDIELLLQLGEYRAGNDADADTAIAKVGDIDALLRQSADQLADYDDTVGRLIRIMQ